MRAFMNKAQLNQITTVTLAYLQDMMYWLNIISDCQEIAFNVSIKILFWHHHDTGLCPPMHFICLLLWKVQHSYEYSYYNYVFTHNMLYSIIHCSTQKFGNKYVYIIISYVYVKTQDGHFRHDYSCNKSSISYMASSIVMLHFRKVAIYCPENDVHYYVYCKYLHTYICMISCIVWQKLAMYILCYPCILCFPALADNWYIKCSTFVVKFDIIFITSCYVERFIYNQHCTKTVAIKLVVSWFVDKVM